MPSRIKKYLPVIYGGYFNLISYFSKSLTGKLAFYTFSKVRKGRVLPQQSAFLEEARHDKLLVDGYRIQTYHWKGKGATILLVHGWESNSSRWRKLIGHLREEGYDVWAFDAPAHGHSSGKYFHVPLYSECMWQMINTYHPSHIVAHSVGGFTTLFTHYKYPDSGVDKIVIIGSHSEFSEIMEQYRVLLKLNGKVMKALDDYVYGRFGLRINEFSTSLFTQNISQKGLIIHDRHDPIAPFHAAEAIHSQWKGSILLPTEGLGHSVQQDEVHLKILDFLKT